MDEWLKAQGLRLTPAGEAVALLVTALSIGLVLAGLVAPFYVGAL